MSKYRLLFADSELERKGFEQNLRNNRVIHRAIGDIPGCKPPIDVFLEISLEEMCVHTGKRADEFCRLLDTIGTSPEFKNHPWFNGDVPVSVIKNPAPPTKGSYYDT